MRSKSSRRSCWHHIHVGTTGEGHVAPRIDLARTIRAPRSLERIKSKKEYPHGQHRDQSDPHGAATPALATPGDWPLRQNQPASRVDRHHGRPPDGRHRRRLRHRSRRYLYSRGDNDRSHNHSDRAREQREVRLQRECDARVWRERRTRSTGDRRAVPDRPVAFAPSTPSGSTVTCGAGTVLAPHQLVTRGDSRAAL